MEDKFFENKELDSIARRSLAILESLANLGKYYEGIGVATTFAVQTAIRRNISKEEFDDAVRAMNVLATTGGEKKLNAIYDEYKMTILNNLRRNARQRWTKRLTNSLLIPYRKLILKTRLRKT